MIIGIDIGGTTTDIVGLDKGQIINPLTVTANDPVTSAAGALGKFLEVKQISLNEISVIAATGVGASKIKNNLFGIPVKVVDEFTSTGTAGSFLSGYKFVPSNKGPLTTGITFNSSPLFKLSDVLYQANV